MTQPSNEDEFTRDMNDIEDLGEQVFEAFKNVDDPELLRKGLERIKQ